MRGRCDHCPAGGPDCPGLRARRLCDLSDPAHADFDPAYIEGIARAARTVHLRAARPAAIAVDYGTAGPPVRTCCHGG